MKAKELEPLLQQVRQNLNTIESCPRHFVRNEEFIMIEQHRTLTCKVCGGQFTRVYLGSYIQGYKAAGGNPNDVVPGWDKKGTE